MVHALHGRFSCLATSLQAVLDAWGNEGGPEDLDGSGTVDFDDMLIVLASWGPCPE